MALISVSDDLAKKSFTSVENKFITKYMPFLEPVAVKVYLFSLYVYQNALSHYTIEDFAKKLNITEDEVKNYFEYLEEFELVSVISLSPFEVKIQDADNLYGKPKKYNPEKYADFSKSVQNIISGRMISTNEYREYFLLLEEYGFEQNALLMIITYCVNLKGDNIRLQYIKKVAKGFADDGITTAKKVDEKLSAYTSSTPALLRIFSAIGLKKQPDIDDDKLYKKWTVELGFEDEAIIASAKHFKAKTTEKLDNALTELYKNKKFDVKEIEDYCNSKNSVYSATLDIAKALGVYMQNSAPYVENFVNVWYDYGYTLDCMRKIASYCFMHGKKSFEEMNDFICEIYKEGIVTDESLEEYLNNLIAEDGFIKRVLYNCGLTRKIISNDRENLSRWRNWNFNDEMILEASKLSAGKSNPIAYMNGILSSWKNEGAFSPDKIQKAEQKPLSVDNRANRAVIERHFYDLRHKAEDTAEQTLARAMANEDYSKIHKDLNELSIQYAFAEIRNSSDVKILAKRIKELEAESDRILGELCISKDELTPQYSCKKCNDTGYDKNGQPCECMKKFIASLK